jgi:hypothetical protein
MWGHLRGQAVSSSLSHRGARAGDGTLRLRRAKTKKLGRRADEREMTVIHSQLILSLSGGSGPDPYARAAQALLRMMGVQELGWRTARAVIEAANEKRFLG